MDGGFKYSSEEYSGKLLELVKEKGVYHYEYMDSFKRFSEDKLPDKCKFFSSLKDRYINKEEYERAINIWNVFKIKTLREYCDLHVQMFRCSKTYVLLLADVSEKFIKTCLEYYK